MTSFVNILNRSQCKFKGNHFFAINYDLYKYRWGIFKIMESQLRISSIFNSVLRLGFLKKMVLQQSATLFPNFIDHESSIVICPSIKH